MTLKKVHGPYTFLGLQQDVEVSKAHGPVKNPKFTETAICLFGIRTG